VEVEDDLAGFFDETGLGRPRTGTKVGLLEKKTEGFI
jgi:hypothetical protein